MDATLTILAVAHSGMCLSTARAWLRVSRIPATQIRWLGISIAHYGRFYIDISKYTSSALNSWTIKPAKREQ
jgi:hypothetical protein